MTLISSLGYLAALLTIIAFIPQAIKSAQSKSTKDIAVSMYYFVLLGSFVWIIYGVLTKQTAIYLANATVFLITLYTTYLIHKHRK